MKEVKQKLTRIFNSRIAYTKNNSILTPKEKTEQIKIFNYLINVLSELQEEELTYKNVDDLDKEFSEIISENINENTINVYKKLKGDISFLLITNKKLSKQNIIEISTIYYLKKALDYYNKKNKVKQLTLNKN